MRFTGETKYPEMSNLVTKVETQHHTITSRKKKGVARRFNTPWAPSYKTRIFRFEERNDEIIVKNLLKKYFYIVAKILEECGVRAEQYDNALGCVEKKVSILYKRKPCEVNTGPYHTVIFLFLHQPKITSFIYPSDRE